MSDLHHLLTLSKRPIVKKDYIDELRRLLKNGIPATYTLEQATAFEKGEEIDENSSNTTPLHILCRSLPSDEKLLEDEKLCILSMMDLLFEFGAGWNFLDYENKHVGDILLENGYTQNSTFYQRIVKAGISAELLLRKINGGEIEFLEDISTGDTEISQSSPCTDKNPATDQETYLNTELEYTDHFLITKENKDGVMMDWETDIMRLAASTLLSTAQKKSTVLNIGFGMGIIDSFIQSYSPTEHYICEAHPDVLAKMKNDGWYEKPGVIILEGRWQDTLYELLEKGEVFFDGIYYDTFSEHYEDMLDLYDIIVGLLKPHGIFSFFNGLGADRQICYDVYRSIVELDVKSYGMICDYKTVKLTDLPSWDKVKQSYYNCNYYYHPIIKFM